MAESRSNPYALAVEAPEPPPWTGTYTLPFKVERSLDIDEKQGPGSGKPAFVIRDSLGAYVVGDFPSRNIAESWLIGVNAIYRTGFNAGRAAQ